jgi:lipopolysaccharide/colanic/teichoic acid biosynthesis glycosyltransferase
MSTAELTRNLINENSLFERYSIDATASAASRSSVWKTIVDRTFALLLLIPGLPLIALLLVVVRLTSRGPGLYRQVRAGKGNRPFLMYKLRSMCVDAEAGSGPVWAATEADPRVTPVGHWLRRLHLDELPQLFNVLKGEMSLVGPRPERPEFVAVLAEQIPGYLDRLKVLPGITGLAQVNLSADTDLDSVRRKLVLDREYIAHTGMWLDQRILLCTLLRLFGLRGGRAVRLFGLERIVSLPPWKMPTSDEPTGDAPAPPTNSAGTTRENTGATSEGVYEEPLPFSCHAEQAGSIAAEMESCV